MSLEEPSGGHAKTLSSASDRSIAHAARLFEEIGVATRDGDGVTRDPYGRGEQLAHDILRREADLLGLEVEIDAALNLWMTWPGRRRDLPRVVLGSHLDSVPRGGNFDGLAGVLAALATVETMIAELRVPKCDVVVLAIRSEENAWFGAQHVGSCAILGKLTAERLDTARRLDTRRTLRDHMIEAGADTDRIATQIPLVDIDSIGVFIECHIEQGPALAEADLPIGMVTAIRGNRRYRDIVCRGEYGHSGVVPRAARRDAVFAVADVIMRLDRYWADVDADGGDLVVTVGRHNTDAAHHGVTVIPGESRFCLDVRAHDETVLDAAWGFVQRTLAAVAQDRGVTFDIAPQTADAAVTLNAGLLRHLREGCTTLGIDTIEMPSGAGHDVADFAQAGIPSALIFIRNENGSHNPAESMEICDFAEAVRLLTWAVDGMASVPVPVGFDGRRE